MHAVHITTVHQRYDNRIYLKECCSLANRGYQVSMIVADGKGDEELNGIQFLDVGKAKSRVDRIFFNWLKACRVARKTKADIYHLHDPELIILAGLLAISGRKVIYDAHEDTAVQIKAKPYLNKYAKFVISGIYEVLEKNLSRLFAGIVTASPLITNKFSKYNKNSVTVSNFPIAGMFKRGIDWDAREDAILYVGGIARNRGFTEVVEALSLCKTKPKFFVGGAFESQAYQDAIESMPAYDQLDYRGYVYPDEYVEMTTQSRIGMNMAYPRENYLEAFATKMFDYMDGGIPFICSNFEKWSAFIEKYECGIAVDPLNPAEIAEAIDRLLSDPEECRRLGENGIKAIDKKFNWKIEEAKMFALYDSVLNPVA